MVTLNFSLVSVITEENVTSLPGAGSRRYGQQRQAVVRDFALAMIIAYPPALLARTAMALAASIGRPPPKSDKRIDIFLRGCFGAGFLRYSPLDLLLFHHR
jgi:hypothetical protein